MTKHPFSPRFVTTWSRVLAGLGLAGACTVVDKGDYTFTDDPEGAGGESGSSTGKGGTAGSTGGSGKGGKGATSGEGGETNGGTSGTSGTSGGGGEGGEDGGLCDPNPCQNGGTCRSSGTTTTCDCADGYEGVTCEDEIDECDPNPCQANAPCTDHVADFTCACPAELAGKTCDLPRFQPTGAMGPRSHARAVSADGTIVLGRFADPMGFDRPFLWTFEDGVQPLPIPVALRPDVHVTPLALSGNGERWVGQSRGNAASDPPFPVGGTRDSSMPYGMPPNTIAGAVFDIAGGGDLSVGYATGDMNTGLRAVRWDERGTPLPLMPPMPSTNFHAGAVTRDGQIITGSLKDGMTVFIVAWAQAGATAPGIRRPSMALDDIEVHGSSLDATTVVGTMWDTAYTNFAFVTMGSSIVNIAPIVGPVIARSNAWDVSDDGQVLAGDAELMGNMGLPQQEAVLWKPDGSFRRVADILRESRIDVMSMGFRLVTAYGVSADGKVVVGEAVNGMGNTQGYIARLP